MALRQLDVQKVSGHVTYFFDFSISACAAAPPGSLMALGQLDVQKDDRYAIRPVSVLPM